MGGRAVLCRMKSQLLLDEHEHSDNAGANALQTVQTVGALNMFPSMNLDEELKLQVLPSLGLGDGNSLVDW